MHADGFYFENKSVFLGGGLMHSVGLCHAWQHLLCVSSAPPGCQAISWEETLPIQEMSGKYWHEINSQPALSCK